MNASLASPPRSPARLVGWIFGLALLLRLACVLRGIAIPAAAPYPDEELHWQLATNLVQRGVLVTDDGRLAARMPVYPLFLAVFAAMGPAGAAAARLAQALLGALCAVLGYRIARRGANPAGAAVAGLLIAVDPFAIFFANLLLTEVVFTFLLLLLVDAALELWSKPRSARARFALAALGPLLVLTRPSAAALVPLVWLVLLPALVRRKAWRPAVLAGAAGAIVLFLPWGLRNQTALGTWAWLSTNGGVTLYDAQGPQADGSSNQRFVSELADLPQGEVARDAALRTAAVAQIRADPGRVFGLAVAKFRRMWSPWPNVAEYRSGLAANAGAVYSLVLMVGAVLGTVRTVVAGRGSRWSVRGRRTVLVAWALIGYFTLLHCVFIGSLRYRVPLSPLLAAVAIRVIDWKRHGPGH